MDAFRKEIFQPEARQLVSPGTGLCPVQIEFSREQFHSLLPVPFLSNIRHWIRSQPVRRPAVPSPAPKLVENSFQLRVALHESNEGGEGGGRQNQLPQLSCTIRELLLRALAMRRKVGVDSLCQLVSRTG